VALHRSRFDHVGLVTEDPKEGESWVEATRCWVTSPRAHPFNVEWLRFEPDSPVTGALRTEPHVAYRVDDVHQAIENLKVLAEPFDVGNGFLTVAFVEVDGAVVEFMQYTNPNEEGWF
jgi:catechol 2,3-dioxygenase-like lactoylglutathione lyase family enzyme